jgi:hypothetical protein
MAGPWEQYQDSGEAPPWEQYTTADIMGEEKVDPYKDHNAFNAEVRHRFASGASAADLEDFAKAHDYELRGLSDAINSPDRSKIGVVSGQAPTDGTPHVVHLLRGGMANVLGPQISRTAADVAGGLGGYGGAPGREIAADADREEFANNYPWLSTALNIAGTIPVAAVRGGAAVIGGLTGAMQSDSQTGEGVALDAGMGAVGGVVGDRVVRGVAHAVAPVVSPYVRRLVDAGVNLTPGQTVRTIGSHFTNFLSDLEDRATSLPIVGDMISADRRTAQNQFVRGAAQRVLNPIREALPAVDNGNEAVAFTRRAMTRAYDRALGSMRAVPDTQYASDLAAVAARRFDGTLSGDAATQFGNSLDSIIGQRSAAMPHAFDGEALKAMDSELRKRAAQTTDPALRDAYASVRNVLKGAAVRSSPPEAVAALNNADEAYANYVRVRRAAASAPEGNFSPNQLRTAVKTSDTSVGKGDTAAGEALMQDYSTAGQAVLPSRMGDSGTAGRAAVYNPLAWALGGAAAPVYSAARRFAPLLTREAGAQAQTAADLLRASAAPVAGLTAPYIGPPITQAGAVLAADTYGAGTGAARFLATPFRH